MKLNPKSEDPFATRQISCRVPMSIYEKFTSLRCELGWTVEHLMAALLVDALERAEVGEPDS